MKENVIVCDGCGRRDDAAGNDLRGWGVLRVANRHVADRDLCPACIASAFGWKGAA
jgi:hypothetical protein